MSVDWTALFTFSLPPLELVVRGSAFYLFLFLLFRLVIRRRVGAVGMADILVLVIVSDAAQNAMSGDYRSIADGMLLVGTIIGWTVLIDWLSYRFAGMQKLLEPPPLLLIHRGRILHRNLRMELVAESELAAKLREQGIDDPAEVERAYLESDGAFTVIRRRGRAASNP